MYLLYDEYSFSWKENNEIQKKICRNNPKLVSVYFHSNEDNFQQEKENKSQRIFAETTLKWRSTTSIEWIPPSAVKTIIKDKKLAGIELLVNKKKRVKSRLNKKKEAKYVVKCKFFWYSCLMLLKYILYKVWIHSYNFSQRKYSFYFKL